MECIFLNSAGKVLFTRLDMESGHWVQQEMSVNADFPFVADKVIERGQRIAFRDPATDVLQMFEIRNVTNNEPDHFQQITAEHIALAELQDEHIKGFEVTDKTAGNALSTALSGTGWVLGQNNDSTVQSADIHRGSVWNAITTIQQNWNVYITPRIVVDASGNVTGKYLDITTAGGVWRGIRLSIRKNLIDPVVTYNDTEVLTALYGYGGNVTVSTSGEDDTTEELTFASAVWSKTSEHPAKPSGQKFLEWPEKTALYGRNGRARYGYYQNADIKDANTLLQKTWEALKKTCEPKISIAGTCVDLYRLGYHDEPLRLHDLAIVEIEETGEVFQKEIIMLDVDLIDPTGSRPEIGDYIPNIVYINRETNESATGGSGGGRGGGGGGRGKTKLENDNSETFTEFVKTKDLIGMVVGTRDGNNYIKVGEICLAINKSGETGEYESTALINATHVNISATNDVHTLAGDVEHDAEGRLIIKNAGGMYVKKTEEGVTSLFGVWDENNLTGGVIVEKVNGQTTTKIKGTKVVIGDDVDGTGLPDWISTEEGLVAQKATIVDLNAVRARVSTLETDYLQTTNLSAAIGSLNLVSVHQLSASSAIGCTGPISCTEVSISGNTMNIYDGQVSNDGLTLTLFRLSGGSLTFSKATTLSGAWSGGTFTVTASPQNKSFSTNIVQGTLTWDGNIGTIPINASDSDNSSYSYFTGRNVSVDATSIYNNGSPSSGAAVSRHGSAWNWDFSITKGDGTKKTLTIDVSDIVTAAREGYTLGIFTQATVTPQGASDSVYVEVSSGGTNYYKAGTKATYYNAGSTYTYYAAGSSATYYNAGTSKKTALGTKHTPSKKTGYYRGSQVTGTNQGSAWNSSTYPLYYKYNGSYNKITAKLYYGGSAYTHYAGGSSFTYYDVGTSEDCYEAGSEFTVQGSSTTVTTQGREVSVTVQGAAVEVTPISGNALMLAATTRYKAGTEDSTTYYTKS